MKKGKLWKGFVLAMAMVMLFSVTAFAYDVSWYEAGAFCTGEVGRTSATTTAGTPMYVEAIVYCEYYIGGILKNTREESTNAGTRITAYATIPSGGNVQKTEGAHRAGNSIYYFTNYPWELA